MRYLWFYFGENDMPKIASIFVSMEILILLIERNRIVYEERNRIGK